MINQEAKLFFEKTFNKTATSWKILPQSGSSRKNFIGEIDEKLYVITENENILENNVFFYFSNIFSQENLNTPKIFGISEDKKIYIQEFLGENTLSEVIAKEGLSPRVEKLVQQALDKLFQLQKATENKIDFTKAFEYETYNELPILHDLYYFKNFIADVLELEYHKATLLLEFKEITKKVEQLSPRGIMIRDFQARNIMVDKENIFFIDYQGAMEGPLMYDVISFLFQAKANFPKDFKSEMLNYYISLFKGEKEKEDLKNSIQWLQLMRFLQVLGAYGFRGLIQRKSHFITSLEQGIQNISEFISYWEYSENYPELKKVVQQLTTEQTQQKIKELIH